jgi:hypothetical protein
MLFLELYQFSKKPIVFFIGQDRAVQYVIEIIVVLNLFSQLCYPSGYPIISGYHSEANIAHGTNFDLRGRFVMIGPPMNAPVIRKILFTVAFPGQEDRRRHISWFKLHSLAKKQLSDMDVIETIEHLFGCQRCFENYRRVRKSYLKP